MIDVMSLAISAGGVYRFSRLDNGRFGFIDKPEVVEIDEHIAARCEPTGTVYYIDEALVAEFVDQIT
jgi:hypothetical protein